MASVDDSEAWLHQVAEKEEEAFRLLFDRYAPSVLHFLYHLVGEKDMAEDLTQETFLRAYLHLGRLRDPSKLRTWLFGIARNVAREASRARKLDRRSVGLSEAAWDRLPATALPPAEEMLREELSRAVLGALQSLEEEKRLVFVLRVFQQMSYLEIAETTGFSLAKVKSHLHRARQEMRVRLRPYLDTDYGL